MKQRRTPQEKKILRYVHDRRNMYGESRARSIFSIRRRKAIINREYRHKVAQQAHAIQSSETAEEIEASVEAVKRKNWRKCPDGALVHWVANRLDRRQYEGSRQQPPASKLMNEAKRRLKKLRP